MKPAPKYESLLRDGAEALGSTVEAGAPEWIGPALNAEVLGSGTTRPAFQRNENDLPAEIAAVRIDGTPVLICRITGPATKAIIDNQLRRHRNQAAIARSWLGTEGPNLQLFLIGPEGALGNRGWEQVAATIEADDRICRKLVWLFDEPPDLKSALSFLGRTFIATPWDKEGRVQARLDQMAEVGLPTGWQAIVDDDGLDAEGVVNRIIELEGDPA